MCLLKIIFKSVINIEEIRGAESRWQTRRTWNLHLHTTRAPTRHRWGTTDT